MKTKSPLQVYREAGKRVEDLDEKLDKARDEMIGAREEYLESEKEKVFEELRKLEWAPPRGHGARTELVAEVPDDSYINLVRRHLKEEPRDSWNSSTSDAFTVGGVDLRCNDGSRHGSRNNPTIRGDIGGLIKAGIKAKSLDKSEKRKLTKMLKESGLTPDEFQKLLASKDKNAS